jgi:hypothetical protein
MMPGMSGVDDQPTNISCTSMTAMPSVPPGPGPGPVLVVLPLPLPLAPVEPLLPGPLPPGSSLLLLAPQPLTTPAIRASAIIESRRSRELMPEAQAYMVPRASVEAFARSHCADCVPTAATTHVLTVPRRFLADDAATA